MYGNVDVVRRKRIKKGNTMLSREAILSAEDIKIEKVDVPEWGGFVYIKTMSGTARDAFEAEMLNVKKEDRNIRAAMAAHTVCDESGELLFSEQDIVKLGKKSSAALDRILEVSQRLSGLSNDDVEELEKN